MPNVPGRDASRQMSAAHGGQDIPLQAKRWDGNDEVRTPGSGLTAAGTGRSFDPASSMAPSPNDKLHGRRSTGTSSIQFSTSEYVRSSRSISPNGC